METWILASNTPLIVLSLISLHIYECVYQCSFSILRTLSQLIIVILNDRLKILKKMLVQYVKGPKLVTLNSIDYNCLNSKSSHDYNLDYFQVLFSSIYPIINVVSFPLVPYYLLPRCFSRFWYSVSCGFALLVIYYQYIVNKLQLWSLNFVQSIDLETNVILHCV